MSDERLKKSSGVRARLKLTWRAIRWSFEARPKLSFTREGQLFSLTTLALGVAATNSGNNLLYLILGMMLSLILSSGVLSSLNLHKLRVTRRTPSRVVAGEPFEVSMVLQNVKRSWPSMGVTVREPLWRREGVSAEPAPSLREIYCFKIDPQREESVRYEGCCEQRGSYVISGARVITSFPFGLFEKSIGLNARATLRVYPRVDRPLEALGALSGEGEVLKRLSDAESHHEGGAQVKERSREELMGLRVLGPQEPLKLIHWRASAKRGTLMRAQYGAAERPSVGLWVSPFYVAGSGAPDTWEEDEWANLIASACQRLLNMGPLKVSFAGGGSWQLKSSAQLSQLLEWLIDARLQPHEGPLYPPEGVLVISHPAGRSLLSSYGVQLLLTPLREELSDGG